MKTKRVLTEKEWDLIESIRNYKFAHPNGEPQIRYYIEQLFNELLDEPIEPRPRLKNKK